MSLAAVIVIPSGLLLWPMLGYRADSAPIEETLSLPRRDAFPAPEPPKGGTRGPSALLFSPDGNILYITEQDENVVTVMEASSGKVLARIPSGGQQPTALALTPDGKTLVVANTFSGDIGLVDVGKKALRTQIPLRGMPHGVAATADGKAFVAVGQRDEVAVIDLNSAKVTARIPVGRRPLTLALATDGQRLFCSGIGGTLSEIGVQAGKETARLRLPAMNLRGMAFTPGRSHRT
jgi:YVTN family beta-propeller protein